MPAQRVGSAPIAIRQFEVVGQDASSEPGFVGHVALAAEERASYAAAAVLPVLHMRPPLERFGVALFDSPRSDRRAVLLGM